MKKAVIMINAFLVAALIGLISFNNKVEMVGPNVSIITR